MSAAQFTEEETALLLLGMITAGVVGNGGQPHHQSMELLVLHKRRMLELTQKLESLAAPHTSPSAREQQS